MQAGYEELGNLIQKGDFAGAQDAAKALLDGGKSPSDIISGSIVPTLDAVGKKFSAGECFIPEMLIAAKASQKALDVLKPVMVAEDFKPIGKVVIGTVKGDLHDIGKNIVAMMLESVGFEVKDLGVDAAPEAFISTIKEFKPEIVALSCLLSTTRISMQRTVEMIEEANLRDSVKIIIGGPPTTEEYAKEIGADFHGENAFEGIETLKGAMQG
jgi:5-methyltetrahydrofolate--homocysteine methyltransferase